MSEALQGKMAKGAVWMVLFKLVERSLGLVSTLILARLLVPADFGVVAMALSFVFMAELLTAFGFDVAIIQNQAATEEHYSSAWTGNLLLGGLITVLMLASALPIARFYQRPELVAVVCALAFGPLFAGAENIGVVAFRKEMDFRREFKFQVSRKLIGFAVVVPLAFLLRNYWALVVGTLVSKFAATVISYLMHPFRPRLTLVQLRSLVRFSRWLLFNNLVSFLKERSSDFFVGRLHGAPALGIYNIAYEFAHLPSTELSAPINRALLPGFARMDKPEEIRSAYGNAVALLAFLALPSAAGIFVLAPFLVPVILGEKWLGTVPLMQLLAFNGVLLLFHSSMCTVLVGRGRPARVTLANAVYVVLLALLLALLAPTFGVRGAAWAALLTSILGTPVYLFQMRRALGIGAGTFLRAIMRPFLAALLMAAVVHVSLPVSSPAMSFSANLACLLGGIAIGFVSYVVIAFGLWRLGGQPAGAEQIVLDRLRKLLRARQPAAAGTGE
jgi:lipopolysaccharide exporter